MTYVGFDFERERKLGKNTDGAKKTRSGREGRSKKKRVSNPGYIPSRNMGTTKGKQLGMLVKTQETVTGERSWSTLRKTQF